MCKAEIARAQGCRTHPDYARSSDQSVTRGIGKKTGAKTGSNIRFSRRDREHLGYPAEQAQTDTVVILAATGRCWMAK